MKKLLFALLGSALPFAGSALAQGTASVPLPPLVIGPSPAPAPMPTPAPATPLVLAPSLSSPAAATSAAITTTTTVTMSNPGPVPLATLVLKTRLPMREAPRVGVSFVMLMPGTTLNIYGTPIATPGTPVKWMKVGTDPANQGWVSVDEMRAQY